MKRQRARPSHLVPPQDHFVYEKGSMMQKVIITVMLLGVILIFFLAIHNNNTHFYETTTDDGTVKVGFKDGGVVKPEVQFTKWTEDNVMKVSYPMDEDIQPVKEGDKVVWKDEGKEVYFKETKKDPSKPDSGKNMDHFEFDILLKEKPTSNVFTYDIETKGLKFYYQPPLSKEEKARGNRQPENVIGSYAVYHEKHKNAYADPSEADKYKTGKAFHIYRPKIVAHDGKWTWGKLSVDEKKGKLSVSVDPTWLANASYPVIIDPDFGYTFMGSSYYILGTNVLGAGTYNYGGVIGSATSLTAAIYEDIASGTYAYGIYNVDVATFTNGTFLNRTNFLTANGTRQDVWVTQNLLASVAINVGEAYQLVAKTNGIAANNVYLRYDNSGGDGAWMAGATGTTFPASPTFSLDGPGYILSIYATYTAATNTPTPTATNTPTPTDTPTPTPTFTPTPTPTNTPTPTDTPTPTPTPPASSALKGGSKIRGGTNLR